MTDVWNCGLQKRCTYGTHLRVHSPKKAMFGKVGRYLALLRCVEDKMQHKKKSRLLPTRVRMDSSRVWVALRYSGQTKRFLGSNMTEIIRCDNSRSSLLLPSTQKYKSWQSTVTTGCAVTSEHFFALIHSSCRRLSLMEDSPLLAWR